MSPLSDAIQDMLLRRARFDVHVQVVMMMTNTNLLKRAILSFQRGDGSTLRTNDYFSERPRITKYNPARYFLLNLISLPAVSLVISVISAI